MAKKANDFAQKKDIMQTFHSEPPKTTGERLRLWRNICGYSQEKFVSLVGCWADTTTYSKIERGKTSLTPENAEICAAVLGVTKEYLLCEDDNASFLHSIYDNVVNNVHDQINRKNEMITEGKILELLGITWDVKQTKDGQFTSDNMEIRFNDGYVFRINERQNYFLHVFAHDALVTLYDTIYNYCVTSTEIITQPKGGDASD